MQNNIILCPSCNTKCYFLLDEWGRTPYHLHCDTCQINIGVDVVDKAKELLQKYNKKNTCLEYYDNKIHYLREKGREIINE